MNPLLKKTDFKPQFLFVDKMWIASKIRDGKAIEEKLNKAATEVQKVFEKPLTEEEMRKLMIKKYDGVISLLKEKAGLPNAETETFFKLTGGPVDLRAIVEAFNQLFQVHYRIDEYKLKNGRFFLSQESIDSYEKIATYYTKSEKGNIGLKIAKNICKELNEALQNGLIPSASRGEITTVARALKNLISEKIVKVDNQGTLRERIYIEYCPNFEKIRFL